MQTNDDSPAVTPALGDDVAKEVLQWIGAFRLLSKATIISFNMQDYDFWGQGRLSHLLLRQIAYGALITVMTTPPPGNDGKKQAFRDKLQLLEVLVANGAEVYLNPDLHAKAYLFQDSQNSEMVIVGSPNLTSRGFGTKGSTTPDLIELALLTGDELVYSSTGKIIETGIIGNPRTLTFAKWASNNRLKIAAAKGAP